MSNGRRFRRQAGGSGGRSAFSTVPAGAPVPRGSRAGGGPEADEADASDLAEELDARTKEWLSAAADLLRAFKSKDHSRDAFGSDVGDRLLPLLEPADGFVFAAALDAAGQILRVLLLTGALPCPRCDLDEDLYEVLARSGRSHGFAAAGGRGAPGGRGKGKARSGPGKSLPSEKHEPSESYREIVTRLLADVAAEAVGLSGRWIMTMTELQDRWDLGDVLEAVLEVWTTTLFVSLRHGLDPETLDVLLADDDEDDDYEDDEDDEDDDDYEDDEDYDDYDHDGAPEGPGVAGLVALEDARRDAGIAVAGLALLAGGHAATARQLVSSCVASDPDGLAACIRLLSEQESGRASSPVEVAGEAVLALWDYDESEGVEDEDVVDRLMAEMSDVARTLGADGQGDVATRATERLAEITG
ncbi:MAG: hypothetical protein ACYDH5_02850 [Acidimicrobiales bacterium]